MKITILTVDTPNKNNRVYPKFVFEKAINNARKQINERQFMVTKRILGEPAVQLSDVVAVVKDVVIEGVEVIADIEFLDANGGLDLAPLVEKGMVSVRPSGMGSTRENNGVSVVQDDYTLLALNLTNDPA